MLRWFEETPNNDMIISSRIRLARNISAYPFSTKISAKQTERMLAKAGKEILSAPFAADYHDYVLEDLEEIQKEAMVERNVISRYLSNQENAMFFVTDDEKTSIMLNEEDHIRIQCIEPGCGLNKAYERADKIDDELGKKFDYAYDENFGFLTTCPSNVGTGMKASCMMHLPALGNSKKIQNLMGEVGHFGINMKGLFGEDGSGCGHIYQVSNQKTMGQSEREIISNLENIVNQICNQEKECRRQIIKSDRLKLEDEIYKSYGILKYSRRLKYKDAMLFLSELKLGLELNMLEFKDQAECILFQLMIGCLPANLKLIAGREADESELEEIRAAFIRENLPLIS